MAPLIDESKYNDEEHGWQQMSEADVLAWEWRFAHNTPQPRKPSSYDLAAKLGEQPRFLQQTYASGVECIFNYFQEQTKTIRERPHVGLDDSLVNQIWMAFFPSKVDYRGTQFLKTALSNVALQASIEQPSPTRYRLAPSIAASWLSLEEKLHTIIQTLETHVDFPQAVVPPPYPSNSRYMDLYRVKEDAIEAARRARNAFTYLQAYLSFLVSFWHRLDVRRSIDTLALWLAKRHQLDTTWTTMLLKFHPIAYTERVTRLGMTISVDSPWIPFLPIFVECNVRIGVYLNETPDVIQSDEHWPRYRPFVRDATLLHDDPSVCDCDVCQRRKLPGHPLLPDDPTKFIASREEAWVKHCTEMNIPTKKWGRTRPLDEESVWYFFQEGWNVYEWIDVQGCYQRCAVPRSLANAVFATYSPESRYFSPLYSEIDLCSNFAHPAADIGPPEPLGDPPAEPTTPIYHYEEGEEDEYGEGEPTPTSGTATTSPSVIPEWKLILQRRLGFDCSVDIASLPEQASRLPESIFAPTPKGLNKSLQVLGLVPSTWEKTMSEADRTLCAFPLRVLANRDLSLSSLPAQFDIAMRGLLPSLNHFQIQLVQQRDGDKIIDRFAIGTHKLPMNRQHFVVVVDGLTLLEIIRNGWTGILETARNLARIGVPFSTARYYHPSTRPKIRSVPREGLGVLESDTISAESYRHYEEHRDDFLRTPRGALALKEGGFIARLARDVVTVRTLTVAQPPSRDAAEYGRVLGRVREGDVIIADYVEHAEVDTILGRFLRYESANVQKGGAIVQKGVTIWPTMAAWDVMGVNTSAWNDSAEEWYRRKLTMYTREEGPEIKPLGSKAWRAGSKGLAKTRDIWKRYRMLATEYLKREYP
ncbi:hypothetical protein FA13DRAFT_1799272 [Coprinellus micaceus]|uniref:Uncharacterized protein n=1 Tax=Coprinellus micaceus TaxID=71717 RepID=A0A4Y7SJP8_COPMI|nr:hypothetical protein FA13DRAFT_1799272 [Coprinellus micaceus]